MYGQTELNQKMSYINSKKSCSSNDLTRDVYVPEETRDADYTFLILAISLHYEFLQCVGIPQNRIFLSLINDTY